jgi:uncharacterized protein DUF5683
VSGAFGVRGGFDSHAFPPILLLAIGLSLAALSPSNARADLPPGAPGSPAAAPLDSVRTPPVPADTAAVVEVGRTRAPVRAAPAKPGRFSEPRYVMFRSLLIPGWGQLYNRSWIKAGIFAGLEGWMIAGLITDEHKLNELSRAVNDAQARNDETAFDAAVNAYNDRLDRTISRRWLLGGAIAYALVDAYVDAHFRNFDVEFGPDPALPPELQPKGGGKKGNAGGRMSLRWSF